MPKGASNKRTTLDMLRPDRIPSQGSTFADFLIVKVTVDCKIAPKPGIGNVRGGLLCALLWSNAREVVPF